MSENEKTSVQLEAERGCGVFVLSVIVGIAFGILGLGLGLLFMGALQAVGMALVSWIGGTFVALIYLDMVCRKP